MDPLAEVRLKIAKVEAEIDALTTEIKEADENIRHAGDAIEKQRWVKEKEQLRDERTELLKQKNKLLDKEARLETAAAQKGGAGVVEPIGDHQMPDVEHTRLAAVGRGGENEGPRSPGDVPMRDIGYTRRVSGTGNWTAATTAAVQQALDPLFELLDLEGNLNVPCWNPPDGHPHAAHLRGLAIPEWRGEPSLLLHELSDKGKGRGASERLLPFIRTTRAKYGGQQTQLGRVTFGLGVSGCSKTRSALEALCSHFGFYLSFSTAEEPGSRVLKDAVERFRQRFQQQLVELLTPVNEQGLKAYREGKLDDVVKLVVRILVALVLCLERFLKKFGRAATPRKFLMLQLIGLGDLQDWLAAAWECLLGVSLDGLIKELQRAVAEVKRLAHADFLLTVVDEAHLGLKSLENHFPNADNTQGRSLLNAWVRSLDNPAFRGFHFLFTGTRLGITEHESLVTAIGKNPGVPFVFSKYGINSAETAKQFAMKYVPGDDCEPGLWELVSGRYRFSAELTLVRLRNGHMRWESALQTLRKRHMEEIEGVGPSQRTLMGRLSALESSQSYEPIVETLKGLVTDRYVMGVARPRYRKQVDLVELGFCHLIRAAEEGGDEEGAAESVEGLWRMSLCEPLAAVVARVYLERRGRWDRDNEVEKLMLEIDLPSPCGLLWDMYMPTALSDFFDPQKILAEHPILSSVKHRLPPSFFTRPRIVCLGSEGTVSRVTGVEPHRVKRGTQGFGLPEFIDDPRGITFFLPEEESCPDVAHFVALRDGEPDGEQELWFDMVQAKLRPDFELEHALRTVTVDLLYSGHLDREQLVARVKRGLAAKLVKGMFRFVTAFPSPKKTATTEVFHPEESKTRAEQLCTVQVGISGENAHDFFRPEHLKVLRALKGAKKRPHGETK